ncbi:DUF6263 family protein [Pedobacter foliorum]|uniref:DUF6263 family protein n=1 Tax=Pedobacter foliorum TaxID=2739058 RepID=UPI00156646D0|nr:DUF6263 family protein [Pedobacter foliorum]NRF41092.1 hypothetical protein [Pedobacter foliorum]
MRKSLLLFVLSVGLLACKSKSSRILIKLEKGQQYTQHVVIKMITSQKIDGKETSSSSVSDGVSKFEVVNVSDSIYTFKVIYVSLSAKVSVNGDSSVAMKNPMMSVFDALKGNSYQIKMSNTGRVIEVKGADSVLKKIITDMPGLPEESKEMLMKQISFTYGDKAIKENTPLGMNMYPQKLVKEGDTWNFNRKGGENPMEPKMDAVYKLDKITASEYLISGITKMEIGNQSKDSKISGGNPMAFSVSGIMNSNNKIDKKTGVITEIKVSQDLKGSVTVNSGDQTQKGTTIPMTIKGETIVTNTFTN